MIKTFKKLLCIICCLVIVAVVIVFGTNIYVKRTVSSRLISEEDAISRLKDVDCIIVLGCLVHSDGTPSPMLKDRLTRAVALQKGGVSQKLLMSGDHGKTDYDEVSIMKRYAMDEGIASSDIFMDHAGFSTYETIYRAKEVFKAKKVVIVSQEYHLYRALYVAEKLGLEAYGVAADYRTYSGQTYRDVREIAARCKDVLTTAFHTKPTYLGDPIPVSGDGDLTNDKNWNNF